MKTATSLKRILARSIKPIIKLSVSSWADTFRQLPSDSPEPGSWKTSRVPYMKEVMDSFTDPKIRRVVVKSSSQISKTECLLNVVGRYAQVDPCSIFIIQPTLEMAQDFSRSRLSKMIADTKSLTPLFYDKVRTRDKNQTILSKFYTGGRIVLAGANSPASLASRPIRILLCDEVDRFPSSAGDEGDPISLAEKRTSNYWNSKVGIFSTPTTEGTSRVDIEYNLGTQEIWSYRCPNCGEFHPLDYRQMQVDFTENSDAAGNKSVIVKSVRWQCPDCGFEFSELEMRNSPQKYIAHNPDAIQNGVRSFSLNAFSSPWLSWTGIMREWLEAKGDPSREAVIYNTRFGLSYDNSASLREFDENEFLSRLENYDAEIPSGVLLLTAAVDVQANRLEFAIYGWGAGFTCWGIQRGVIFSDPTNLATWRQLDEILDREYRLKNGAQLKISRTFVDSGYLTSRVYDYCSRNFNRGIFPVKGKAGAGLSLLHKYSKPQPGVLLVILGVDDGKSEIFSRLTLTEGNGTFHFGNDDDFIENRGFDAQYFKQLTSERKVIKKSGGSYVEVFEKISAHARNENLDLLVYNLAVAKSCVGKNPAEFWKNRYEQLHGIEIPQSKKPTRKPTKGFHQQDIW